MTTAPCRPSKSTISWSWCSKYGLMDSIVDKFHFCFSDCMWWLDWCCDFYPLMCHSQPHSFTPSHGSAAQKQHSPLLFEAGLFTTLTFKQIENVAQRKGLQHRKFLLFSEGVGLKVSLRLWEKRCSWAGPCMNGCEPAWGEGVGQRLSGAATNMATASSRLKQKQHKNCNWPLCCQSWNTWLE